MNILALIPARGGSKGVPKKNIKLLQGYPLIAHSIIAAKLSNKINKIVVSTDSQEIAEISSKYGAETPFLRPTELANDSSKDIDFVLHALDYLKVNENYTPDLIVLLRPTTPMREIEVVDAAIEKYLNDKKATSLRSSHPASESPFKWFLLKNDYYTPICEKYTLEDTNKPRQDFSEVYIPNGYVDILNPNFIKTSHALYGEQIIAYITPHGYEIDTIEDFKYIEYQISQQDTAILKDLKKTEES
jgi:CMP-N,N'-diacetyllegionaminic acid synthase